ncbi:hypothetical protein H311_00316 [Anncaliia algerae PRA109]|nr:hypothetical protein H311_00316 [Anncaliia algerae PRA109]
MPGSKIYTDCFKSYVPSCRNLNFSHLTVYPKENFVDPITLVHTNTIENLNNGLNHLIKPRNRTKKIFMAGFSIFSGGGKTKKNLERFSKGFKRD